MPTFEIKEGLSDISFRPSSMGPVPYIKIFFPKDSLEEIYIGPGEHMENRVEAIGNILNFYEYSEVRVTKSNIPYRK